jgi:hypothetical protein
MRGNVCSLAHSKSRSGGCRTSGGGEGLASADAEREEELLGRENAKGAAGDALSRAPAGVLPILLCDRGALWQENAEQASEHSTSVRASVQRLPGSFLASGVHSAAGAVPERAGATVQDLAERRLMLARNSGGSAPEAAPPRPPRAQLLLHSMGALGQAPPAFDRHPKASQRAVGPLAEIPHKRA